VPVVTGMVVLDAVHHVQRYLDTELACRWNCKAAKCGSCSAEINGRPALMCKTRVDQLNAGTITVEPLKAFPLIKDMVTDVSRNYEVNREIPPFTPAADDGTPWRIPARDIERLYEHRKCIECFLCQDVSATRPPKSRIRHRTAGRRWVGGDRSLGWRTSRTSSGCGGCGG
jgi:succinate dehydrogenase / fumarate reductase iron-sulfur subunit